MQIIFPEHLYKITGIFVYNCGCQNLTMRNSLFELVDGGGQGAVKICLIENLRIWIRIGHLTPPPPAPKMRK